MADLGGKPVLAQIAERLARSTHISEIWFVTSTNSDDDPIEELGAQLGTKVHRGHPDDVLDRLFTASLETSCEYILEVGGDCPLIDDSLIKHGMQIALLELADVTSNALFEPFTYPVGYDFILITKKALARLHSFAKLQSERYQPFQYIVKNPLLFKVAHFRNDQNRNAWRWTLDYPEDLTFLRTLYDEFRVRGEILQYENIVPFLLSRPDIVAINSAYSHPINVSTAWYTGSYTRELTSDINSILSQALVAEQESKWSQVANLYNECAGVLKELIGRTNHFLQENKSND